MADPKIPLTGKEKNALHKLVANPPLSPNFAATEVKPHLRVFVANFDGTTNDYVDVKPGANQTLVATLAQYMQNDLTHESRYYPGIGTGRTGAGRLVSTFESITGIGCKSKAEQAYDDLIRQAHIWRLKDPRTEIFVVALGFSRGAGTALDFLNMVNDHGIETIKGGQFHGRPVPLAFQPGAVKSAAILFDTVATAVVPLGSPLPNNCVSALHVVAGSEPRTAFPLTSLGDGKLAGSDWALTKGVSAPRSNTQFGEDGSFLYQRLHQISISGASHSDIGDSYGEGYIGRVCEFISLEFLGSLGLPVPAGVKPHFSDLQGAFGHDSRYALGRFIDGVSETLGVERSVRSIKERKAPWNGDVIQTASLTLQQDGQTIANRRIRLAVAHEQGKALPDEKEVDKRVRSFCRPTADGYSFSSRSGRFSLQNDESGRLRLLFDNKCIDDLTESTSVFQRLLDREPGVSLHIDMSNKKQMVPLTDFGQKVAHGAVLALEKKEYAPDPWPPELRRSIQELNAYASRGPHDPVLTHTQALQIMAQCMNEAAATLQSEFPEVEKVRVREKRYGAQAHKGTALWADEMVLECRGAKTTGGGLHLSRVFTAQSQCRSSQDFALQARMQDMSDALGTVRDAFRAEGFNVTRDCDVTYDTRPTPIAPIEFVTMVDDGDAAGYREAMAQAQSESVPRMRMH